MLSSVVRQIMSFNAVNVLTYFEVTYSDLLFCSEQELKYSNIKKLI